MDHQDIVRLLNTDHYSPADLEEVNGICRNYPMFNLAHMLKVRIREAIGQDKESELKVAAVYSNDRKKLFQLVTEVTAPQEIEVDAVPVETERSGIEFSNESNQEADVIIEQHAPYAVSDAGSDLLELDETQMDDHEQDNVEIQTIDKEAPATGGVKKNRLILDFLEDEPGPIRADKKSGLKVDASLASIREHDGFITDTLAQIYVKQGLYAKAIYAYEKLSLKYPEKSAYFAAQIEKIKNINYS